MVVGTSSVAAPCSWCRLLRVARWWWGWLWWRRGTIGGPWCVLAIRGGTVVRSTAWWCTSTTHLHYFYSSTVVHLY